MKKTAFLFSICVILATAALASPAYVMAQEASYQIPVNEDGKEAVTMELKSGTKVVVYIQRETADNYFIQNLNKTMEVSMPRANVAKVRKPTAQEIKETQKRLGISAVTAAAPTAPVAK